MTEKQPDLIGGNSAFRNIVDAGLLRAMFENFSQSTGLTIRLASHPAQELLIATGKRAICTKFHRICPESRTLCRQSENELAALLAHKEKICVSTCGNRLVHGATPVIINNVRAADLFIGPLLLEPPDREYFQQQAERYGFDKTAYLTALAEVPVTAETTFKRMIAFLNEMVTVLAENGSNDASYQIDPFIPATQKQRLDYILQGTNVGTWEWNVQTGVTFFNERWAGMIGYTLDELSPVSINTMIGLCHPDDIPMINETLLKCFNRETDFFECEMRLRHKNGHWIWILDRGKIFSWTDDGRPLWMYGTHQEITDRKQAEAALRQSEAYLQSIFRAAPTGIGVVIDRVLRRANLRLCEMTGYTADELIGQNARILYPDDEGYHYVGREKYRQIEEKGTGTVETCWKHKDGRVLDVLLSSTPIDPTDLTKGVTFTALDITDRKQATEALRASEEKYRSLFNQSVEGIYLHDLNGQILDANKMAGRQSGYSREELTQMTVFDLHPNQGDEADIKREWRQWEQGHRFTIEFDHQRKNGSLYPVEISTGKIQYEGQDRLLAIVQDITERKRAEEQLRESEARFRALFNNAAEGILVADLETRQFVYANPAICKMLGYTEMEITQLSVNDIHPPETLAHTIGEFEAQARGEKVLAPEIACLRKNGTVIYADIHTARVDLDGRAHNIGMFADITARRQAEVERQRMERLESLGTIAGGIAHDFNNLLMGVFGNIELARMGLPDDHRSGTFLDHAHGALDRARRLTGQLLTFAKGGDPILETIDTQEMVKETVIFNLSGSNVLPHFNLPKGLWPVKADKGQMSQVLANLIINAKQAMPDGGRLCVTGANVENSPDIVALDLAGQYVRLDIRDEGTGIPRKIMDRIFDPYFTTKQSGSGLGLAIVHSIITRHGGHIGVDSAPDVGTTVTMHLPAEPGKKARLENETVQEAESPRGESWHILFMDDNEAVRSLGMAMLKKFGHTVDGAVDGAEALEKYVTAMDKGAPYDLVILDLTVPGGMGGKDAVKSLLAVDPEAKVIVSSGYSSDPVIANFSEYGFAGCLIKPFALSALKKEIKRVMAPE